MKLPILLEMNGLKALVVGGGKVGSRRAAAFAEAGCEVTVLTRPDGGEKAVAGCAVSAAPYSAAMLEGVFICAAATDDHALNAKIVDDCKARGILVNAADDPDRSDYFFPSVIRRGDLTLSVCTEGASPSMTREIARTLREQYPESVGEKLKYLKILRTRILNDGRPKAAQRSDLKEIAGWPLERLKEEAERGA